MAQIITSEGPDPISITIDSVGKTVARARILGQGDDLVFEHVIRSTSQRGIVRT